MELFAPTFGVTVRRETADASTRLFEYIGDPRGVELQMLVEHVASLVAIDREATRVEVVLSGEPVTPELTWLAKQLRSIDAAASDADRVTLQ